MGYVKRPTLLNFQRPPLIHPQVGVIILETGSTFNSFFNRQLLENIQACDEIRAYSNGGHMDYFEDRVVSILPALSAYHNHDSLANIISLSEVAQYYRVVMDTEQSNSITVLVSDTHCITFNKAGRGLYAFDTASKPKPISLSPHVCMFSTVAANKESYSLAEVQGAENASIGVGFLTHILTSILHVRNGACRGV